MIIKKNKLQVNKLLIVLFYIFLCLACMLVPVRLHVIAEDIPENEYSDVLEDLGADSAFNKTDYDNRISHPNTELIQIAESTDNQLFLYVHFVGDIKPISKIVFNTETTFEKIDYKSYSVECVSERDNFCKYLVKDFKTLANSHIYSITRFDYPVDKPITGTQEQTYDYISVNQYWTVTYDNGNVSYTCEYLETLVITDKVVLSHFQPRFDALDRPISTCTDFYIAFSTDIIMDNLLEVQIEYQKQKASYQTGKVFGDPYPEYPINEVVYADDTAEYTKDDGFSFLIFYWKFSEQHFKFSKISKPAEFREVSGLSVPKRSDDSEYDWVVTFYHDPKNWDGGLILDYEVPANTTILRLKYVKDGVTYNVGVLDTRTTYHPPAPEKGFWARLWEWLQEHWEIVVIVVIFIVISIPLAPFYPIIFSGIFSAIKAVGHCLLWLLKGLWWLISAPFRLIVHLIAGGD